MMGLSVSREDFLEEMTCELVLKVRRGWGSHQLAPRPLTSQHHQHFTVYPAFLHLLSCTALLGRAILCGFCD